MLKNAVLALLAVAALSTTALAQDRKDLQIFRDISNQVNRYTQFTIFDSVETSSGLARCRLKPASRAFSLSDAEA